MKDLIETIKNLEKKVADGIATEQDKQYLKSLKIHLLVVG